MHIYFGIQYEKAAAVLSEHDPPIVLAKVNADEESNKPLLTEYNVGGFPTLKVFRSKGSVVSDYKGPREADGIVEHLKKLLLPPSLEIKSSDDVANNFDDKKVYVVSFSLTLCSIQGSGRICLSDSN